MPVPVLVRTRVEVSVTWGEATVHIVGLEWGPDAEELRVGLAGLREFRAGARRRSGVAWTRPEFRRRSPVPVPCRTEG